MEKPGRISITLLLGLAVLWVDSVSSSLDSYKLKDVEVKADKDKPVRIFTAEELKKYDGSNDNEPIYMGIKGVVFDVSEGKRFYGKESPYNALVGMDSTRAVAKMSLDPSDLNSDISDLPGGTLKALDDVFEGTYLPKYPVVGYMDYLLEKRPELFNSVPYSRTEL